MHFHFSKNRFLSLSPSSQHKKCAEFLRAYLMQTNAVLEEQSQLEWQKEYNTWCSWIEIPVLQNWDFIAIEERFHWHTKNSGRGLHESDFLWPVSKKDGEKPAQKWLEVTTYLDGLRSCHNIGSIIRTTEAFRLGKLVFSHDMPSPTHAQIIKTAMGSFEHVVIEQAAQNDNLENLLPRPWIAIETVQSSVSYFEYPSYLQPMTIIFGNEERGIRQEILSECDTILQVPLYGFKNSLNVSNCHAIIASFVSSKLRNEL